MKSLPLKYEAIMLRRGFVPIVAIIALALVALLSGTVIVAWRTTFLDSYLPQNVKEFFGKESIQAPMTSDSQEPSSEDSETTAEDPTKNWKTYTNTELRFSFKYPKDWGKSGAQTGIVSLESSDGLVELNVYKDFQGGFEHWSSVEAKDYYTADELLVPVAIMYGEEDPNEVTVFGGPYDMQPNLFLFYLFNKIDYPDGLGIFELIWSTFKFL